MRKTPLFILFGLFLLSQVGCSVQPLSVVMVDGGLEGRTAPKAPFNTPAYSHNIISESWQQGGSEQLTHCRVKYYPSRGSNVFSVVEGMLNDRVYPVILDTGASAAVFVNDVHIRENNLPFYPSEKTNGRFANWGMCDLGGLRIGKMLLTGWPCYYQQQHAEARLFGLPIFKDKTIVVGMPVLKQFKYIEFDNVKREVYFSLDRPFEPGESDSWMQYSFVIEEHSQDNAFLLVNIPIAGEQTRLQLDTGNNGGLAVGTKLWGRINKGLNDVKLVGSEDLYPYIGRVACERGVIPDIEVGNRPVKNVRLSVFPEDSTIIEDSQGLIGMQCFRDTVMVIDFERSLIWLKGTGCGEINSAIL